MRKSYIQIDGKLYDKDGPLPEDFCRTISAPTVMGDLPDFVSPIDNTVVSGRAGMREHCKRHNVVPTADLAGLPPKPSVREYVPDRAAIRELVRNQIYR
jgi:hypothetical protein